MYSHDCAIRVYNTWLKKTKQYWDMLEDHQVYLIEIFYEYN